MKGFTSKAIHVKTFKKDVHGALRTPIYDNAAFEYESSADIQLAFEGKLPAHSYTRITNPTVEDLEQRIRNVTGATAVLALSSGMAAISNFFLTICDNKSNIITSRSLFGNTTSLLKKTLKPWGLEIRYVDFKNPKSIKKMIDKNTKSIFLETITNPQMEVADIKAISKIAKEAGIVLCVDTTLTPPYLFKSKDFGVDVELISGTKYMSGGGTVVGGLIIDNGTYNWGQIEKLKEAFQKVGPFALLTFDLKDKESCFLFMDSLKMVRRATNLNDNKSLIIHPYSTIFCEYSSAEKNKMNLRDTMIRFAVGIEDLEDILEDIEQALSKI